MGHPEILYFSAISAALSPFFAWCLRYPDEEINEGIWGYNAVLYGIACGMVVPVSVCPRVSLRYCCTYRRKSWYCFVYSPVVVSAQRVTRIDRPLYYRYVVITFRNNAS
ncbi:TPA: urea transporter [Escherichia coli]